MAKTGKNSEITISSIAKKAGVSPALVSSVLGGVKSSIRCSDDTRNKVLRVASRMNYQMREANAVGLIHLGITRDAENSKWVRGISPLLSSINFETLKNDKLLNIFAYSLKEMDKHLQENDLPLIFKKRKIDGLIIIGTHSQELLDYLDSIFMPWILMNIQDARNDNMNTVCFDEVFTGVQATQYLLDRGCQNILHATVKSRKMHYSESHRQKGYEESMRQANANCSYVYFTNDDFDGFRANVREIFSKPAYPDGIFAYNERLAFLCYEVLNTLGLSEKVKIITVAWCDKENCDILRVPYVSLPAEDMGKRAFEMLLKRVADKKDIPGVLLRGDIKD